MTIAHSLLPEFDQEMATTRTLLERVPEDRASWKPHAKSKSLGELAAHVANLPSMAPRTIFQTEVDMSPPGGPASSPPRFTSTAALLATFDEHVRQARTAIAGAADHELQVPWSLKNGGHTIFTLPRAAVLRSMLLNHIIHHRGQLSVYLRLVDVPLPPIYGPTADTRMS
ncbi:MAG: DinB family protein [Gemmatimonadaceae bacterium]